MSDILNLIRETFDCQEQDIRTYSPLTLAYIGDGIYDLVIRTIVVGQANRPAGELHRITTGYVKAGIQAQMIAALKDELTETEAEVFRRGRNAKPHTMAKNASRAEYHKATGFEAVMGYLY
ncbi:MAG: ribonuclease III, partial [Butyrivibrio sp.]|nr:ribonuclease III [Butyrivibrio sp.]